jgi:creatinine amidohydrolase
VTELAALVSRAVPRGALLVVPLGSTEQHGPHLPLGTDTVVATALARRLVAALGPARSVLAPTLPFGASGEHEDFPGTVSIGTEVLEAVLVELGRSAVRPSRFGGLVLVNGHGGNADAVTGATTRLRAEGRPTLTWSPSVPGGDAHAGRTETSLLLALEPGLVGPPPWEPGTTTPLGRLLPELRAGGVAAVAPNGVLGDATGASAAEGDRLLAALGTDLLAAVERWATSPDGPLTA